MASYSPAVHQKDKDFIKETVTRFVRRHDEQVFAREVHVDFTDFIDGEPEIYTREEWVGQLDRIMTRNRASQKATSGIFVNLQNPGADKKRPLTCAAMVMAGGDVVQGNEGETVRIEGMYDLGLIRVGEIERADANQNPWRVYRQVARKG